VSPQSQEPPASTCEATAGEQCRWVENEEKALVGTARNWTSWPSWSLPSKHDMQMMAVWSEVQVLQLTCHPWDYLSASF